MKHFPTFSHFALSRPLLGPDCRFPTSGAVNSASSHRSDRDWQEDYLIGMSDIDARWYYERRRWRS